MDAITSFSRFDEAIKLSKSKKGKLLMSRDNLRKHIKDFFANHEWGDIKFHSQGSFALDTNLNPIPSYADDDREEYDIDDGVYCICEEGDKPNVSTFHSRVKEAVYRVTDDTIDKNTCVRVIYADGYHVDLPMYWLDSSSKGAVPQLAHKSKGYIKSDPRAFSNWVSSKISNSQGGQLRRLIRYFKAWVDYREYCNSQIRLPSGFILTILVCNNYIPNIRDDISFSKTARRIYKVLDRNYSCYRPTPPTDEELLSSKGYDKGKVLAELNTLADNAEMALDTKDGAVATNIWQKVFGDRFPAVANEVEKPMQNFAYSYKPGSPWAIH